MRSSRPCWDIWDPLHPTFCISFKLQIWTGVTLAALKHASAGLYSTFASTQAGWVFLGVLIVGLYFSLLLSTVSIAHVFTDLFVSFFLVCNPHIFKSICQFYLQQMFSPSSGLSSLSTTPFDKLMLFSLILTKFFFYILFCMCFVCLIQ